MGSGKRLKRAIAKYGIENFKKEVLFQFDNESEMNVKESELVTDQFCLREDTYNLCPGGKGGWGYVNSNGISNAGWKTNSSSEAKKRASKGGNAHKQKLLDSDYKFEFLSKRQNFIHSRAFSGKSHSDETKKKIAEQNAKLQAGSLNSQFGTKWVTDGFKSIKINKTDPIPEGWRPGRKMNSAGMM